MSSKQSVSPTGAITNLAHHARRDGRIKSTPGFIAVNRIKKLIQTVGHRGMATLSELIEADPSLAGLDRPEILDQIIGYGKFDTMEIGEEIYVSTGIRNVAVPARTVPKLRQMFVEARKEAGNPPLVAALQGSGWHVDDLAQDRVWSLRRLVGEVGKELDLLDQVNGVIGEIRKECSRRAGSEIVQVSRVRSSTPDLSWIANGLLGCIIATDGTGRQLYLTGKNNRRLVVSSTLPPGKRIVLPEPSEEIEETEADTVITDSFALQTDPASPFLSPERLAMRRAMRKERLLKRMFKDAGPIRGRARRGVSRRRRLLRSSC